MQKLNVCAQTVCAQGETVRANCAVRREHDAHGRVTRVAYAKGEVETFAYDVWGRLARADYGEGGSEDFHWDGLALVRRGDEWNQLAYCGNGVADGIDYLGAATINFNVRWTNFEFQQYYHASDYERIFGDIFDTDCMQLTGAIWNVIFDVVLPRVENQIDLKVRGLVLVESQESGRGTTRYTTSRAYDFKSACWALGDGTVTTSSRVSYSWYDAWRGEDGNRRCRYYVWSASVMVNYSDVFEDPLDVGIEFPFSKAYSFYHTWNTSLANGGVLE